jgi:protein KRI1
MATASNEKKSLFEEDDEDNFSSASSATSSSHKLSSSSPSSSPSSSDNNVVTSDLKLTVNKKYATEYQHRKEREELRQVQQQRDAKGLYEDGNDNDDSTTSSDDEEEDEDGALLTPSVNIQFLKTIKALRQKSDVIYDPNQRFFEDDDQISEKSRDRHHDHLTKSKPKPKRYKDVVREQILEQMEQDDEEESHSETIPASHSRLAYNEQQDELRKAFLQESDKLDGVGSGGNSNGDKDDDNKHGDEWMVLKKRSTTTINKNTAAMEEQAKKELEDLKQLAKQKCKKDSNTFRDPRGEIEDGEQFLYDFIQNKKWIDTNDRLGNDNDHDVDSKDQDQRDDESSLEDINKADEFESNYNFRFEQAAAETGSSGALLSVKTYARGQTMNTLRREDTSRKEKRQARNERKVAERKAKEEQLKRLKNAKHQELNQKLAQVKSVIGAVEEGDIDEVALMKMLEGDYDPEQFEKAMQEAYGDDFYQKEDAEWKSDLDVRRSLKEDDDGDALVGQDDVDGGMYDNFDGEEGDGEDIQQDNDENEEWNDDEDNDFYDASQQEETELEKKLKAKMQDELYKLDYEDVVAGMPTRFKYRAVEPNDYGLTTQEILFARDSSLKQFVSLKRMAPYNENGEFHVGSKKRRKFREQLKQDLEEEMGKEDIPKNTTDTDGNEMVDIDEPNKRKRRRLKKKGKKGRDEESVVVSPEELKVEASVTPQVSDMAHEANEKSKKRRRKKSGKKGMAVLNDEIHRPSTNDMLGYEYKHKTPPPSSLSSLQNANSKSCGGDAHTHTNNRRRKGKKTKKLVDGVSCARLAAYGL